jgi:hypothetical protein
LFLGSAVRKSSNNEIKDETNFDIGKLPIDIPSENFLAGIVSKQSIPFPSSPPADKFELKFPVSILKNNGFVIRDWLVWSNFKIAIYCLPCRLFFTQPVSQRVSLAQEEGWSSSKGWHNLYNRVPEHERSIQHKTCYLKWRQLQINIQNCLPLAFFEEKILSEMENWKKLLTRFLDVILFLAERGLALRGQSSMIGDPHNGNFLGMLELLAKYDDCLTNHLKKVKTSQDENKRMQVHYLSPEIQNEF